MILNKNAVKVLCFGDSLTWGHFHSGIRFELKDRWTYKLQEIMGSNFDILEEGLRSRTTNIDDVNTQDRNGIEKNFRFVPFEAVMIDSVQSFFDILVHISIDVRSGSLAKTMQIIKHSMVA